MTNPLNPNDAGATVTFDDEFNSLSLWNGTSGTWDTTYIFASPTGNGSTLASNGEQEWYINSNYAPTDSVKPWTVNNGILTITAAPASAAIQPLINGYQYTSGQLNTSQSFSQTYGYFEMTAKLPAGQGMWPAFWLLPESGAWPPEIDAMEVLGNNPSTLYTSVHSGTASDEISSDQANTVANTSTSFNTYGVDWEPNFITWYFDGQPVYQVATPAALQNIPMYMIVNLAVGGGWPGDVNSTTPMPAQMQIEDVRAFASLPDAAYLAAEAVTATPGTLDQTAAATYTVPAGVQDVQLIGTASQTVTANSLGDVITSNDYGSTLIGGSGNDTLIAGHRADVLTGGGGDNVFEFNYLPWNAGQITDFHVGTDTLDLSALLSAAGYTGNNAVADGYVSFVSNGAGGTEVLFNSHSASDPWPTLITTLDGVAPTGLTAANVLGEAGASSLPTTVIQTDTNAFGSVSLTEVGNQYYYLDNSSGSGPALQQGGVAVVASNFGGWAPIGAALTASGYEIAWKAPDADQYVFWTTDSSGNMVSGGVPAVSGTNYLVESNELSFNQDLNGDGVIGPTTRVIQTDTNAFGSVSLTEVGNQYYYLDNSSGSGPALQQGGVAVVASNFGGWAPIGAALTASGYEIAWKAPDADQYVFWTTDSSGNMVSGGVPAVSGTNYLVESNELSFNQDLNGDGVIGPTTRVIQTDTNAFGSVSLTEVGNQYYYLDNSSGSGPALQQGGVAVVASNFGGWAPIGAALTASGYEIAWKAPDADQYVFWTTDSSGNMVSGGVPAVSGTNYLVESNELSFNQDLNGDGVIGPTTRVIQTDTNAFGSVSLTEVGNQYYYLDNSSGSGPALQQGGVAVVASNFGGWAPIGAALTASGYEIAWKAPDADQYVFWTTDSSGNMVSGGVPAVSGTNYLVESNELSFNQDLNGDGVIGPTTRVIQTDTNAFGSVSLTEVGNQYYYLDNSSGSGPALQQGGVAVVASNFGGWAPIGAALTASGYEIAWKAPDADQYVFWTTDSGGNMVSGGVPAVSGTNYLVESNELSFNQDLNGDGVIGPPMIQTSAATYTLPNNVQDVQLTGTTSQTVTGNSLNDIITSNDYGSTLIAGSGNDTLIAGHGADVLTGGAGSDTFEFNYQPWNAGKITNFNPATDVLDLHGLFAAVGYHGTNPVADGYLSFVSDGAGDTKVIFDPQGPSTTIPIQITTLEHVSPASLQAHTDWIF